MEQVNYVIRIFTVRGLYEIERLLRNIKFENQTGTLLSKRGWTAMFTGVLPYLAILWQVMPQWHLSAYS